MDKTKRYKKLILLAGIMLFSTAAMAQWECPSRVGGSLKPIGSSDLMWASEFTTSAGVIGDYSVGNAMAFLGLDYSQNNFTVYAEGGIKSWIRFNSKDYQNSKYSLGLREAFFRYKNENQSLTIGLQSTQGEDFYLINERVAGVNYRSTFGNWSLNALTGTVMDQFARNGTFCTLGYLYNIVPGRQRANLGYKFGQTNPALLTLSYHPKAKQTFASTDEFGASDEFVSESELSTKKSSFLKLNTVGALLYNEYGSQIETPALFSGLFVEAEIAGLTFKPEIIMQSADANKALLYSFTVQKQISWNNGQQTRIFGKYIGIHQIDSTAIALNSFSNVFAGEVLRMDALELPLVQAGIKQSFPSLKASLKVQMAMQTGQVSGYISDPYNPILTNSRMKEYDLAISKNFGKNLLVNGWFGYMINPNMTGPFTYETSKSFWGKIEMRLTF